MKKDPMADVKVRRSDDWVVEQHRHRAAQAGHSLEEELRRVLTDTALARRREWAAQLALLRQDIRERYGLLAPSEELIRAERDATG